jgi:hypothetical protein
MIGSGRGSSSLIGECSLEDVFSRLKLELKATGWREDPLEYRAERSGMSRANHKTVLLVMCRIGIYP